VCVAYHSDTTATQPAHGEREPSKYGDYWTGGGFVWQRKPGSQFGAFVTHAQNLTVVAKYSERLSSTCLLHCVKQWWLLLYRIFRHQTIRAAPCVPQKNLATAKWLCNHGFRWFPPTPPDTWLPFFFCGATTLIGPWPVQYFTSRYPCPCPRLLHPLIFVSNEESLLMSLHLSRGRPTVLLLWNFASSTFFSMWLLLDKQNKQQPTTEKGFVPDWDCGWKRWMNEAVCGT
jgi:hypothetical protein